MSAEDTDLAKKRFIVCIDEIQQNFVFSAEIAAEAVSQGHPLVCRAVMT